MGRLSNEVIANDTWPEDIQAAASDLLNAQDKGQQIGLISEHHPHITSNNAYVIQRIPVEHYPRLGWRIVGWKFGLTSKAMQGAWPRYARFRGALCNMWFPTGSIIPPGCFIIRTALSGAPSRDEVLEATAAVVPDIEILDTRILRSDP